MEILKTLLLFVATAVAEIVGCYLPYLWLKQDRSAWLLLPAAGSLALFAWLLTLHPTAAGRVYAAYGGVYVGVASGHRLADVGRQGAPHEHRLAGCGGVPDRHGHHHVRTSPGGMTYS
ncbi:MAG: YnfA family protein [Burkholderiaceae bacterium]|nr:YnfA family protein [Burkholderiaceae bacterium]